MRSGATPGAGDKRGARMRVKVAQMRLCASRAVYVMVNLRETQGMVFDAHARGFAFFGGSPPRLANLVLKHDQVRTLNLLIFG